MEIVNDIMDGLDRNPKGENSFATKTTRSKSIAGKSHTLNEKWNK